MNKVMDVTAGNLAGLEEKGGNFFLSGCSCGDDLHNMVLSYFSSLSNIKLLRRLSIYDIRKVEVFSIIILRRTVSGQTELNLSGILPGQSSLGSALRDQL